MNGSVSILKHVSIVMCPGHRRHTIYRGVGLGCRREPIRERRNGLSAEVGDQVENKGKDYGDYYAGCEWEVEVEVFSVDFYVSG